MRGGLSHFRAGIMVAWTKEVLDRAAATNRIAKWSPERHPAVSTEASYSDISYGAIFKKVSANNYPWI